MKIFLKQNFLKHFGSTIIFSPTITISLSIIIKWHSSWNINIWTTNQDGNK
jgi:hypothetical protein